ncbi:hypothetical protein [Trabulsiella odontotermitis]|uniref:hypothetical protein n=1 Tax=Trabulsiella odontotermitis TaxID=379893 RepID=UPI001EE6B994|nr:hypothetical protein [Trabulsiella odontotermitis]
MAENEARTRMTQDCRHDMELLFFKLVATPLLLLAATLAGRRWGETVGGLVVGLPLTSGPISLFLALEQGPEFATNATSGSLCATAAQACFAVAWCRSASAGWGKALLAATVAFAISAGLLEHSTLSQSALFIIDILVMALALMFIPKITVRSSKLRIPRWDLPVRILLIAALVVAVTLLAPFVGAGVSGILAAFPLMATILAVFAQRNHGPHAAQQVMRGMVGGSFSFAVFFWSLSLLLPRFSLLMAYSIAVALALLVQSISVVRMQRPSANTLTH